MSQDSEPVVKLPRGRGLKLSGPELFRIALTLAMLIAVVALTRPCSTAVSTFVMGMDGKGSAVRKPGAVEPQAPKGRERFEDERGTPDSGAERYERLTPGMSESDVRSAIERAKAKNAPSTNPANAER